MTQAQRTYKPESVSVAHIDVIDRTQPELWQWWIWAAELLAALKAALCALSYKHGDPLAERARAIIAKAEGR